MRVLAIESCGSEGGVALVEDGRTLAEKVFETGMVHGRDIAPAIAAIGGDLAAVDRIAVDIGPGSYTGLRVGIASAQGLCLALGKPAAGVASLDALARQAGAKLVATVIDAKWDQVYGAVYEDGRCTTGFLAEAPAAFAARVPKGAVVIGDAVKKYGALFAGATLVHALPRASTIGRLALEAAPVDAARLVPLYLRKTEAEIKFGSK